MSNVIRSLGFYQPFGSLMLNGKIETRWVRNGKKPPFPLGEYLLYTTLKKCDNGTLFQWCGAEIMSNIISVLENEPTKRLNGFAIAKGELYKINEMRPDQEQECFVKYGGIQVREDKNGRPHEYIQQCLYFRNVVPIHPFSFKGKQGVGILTEEEKSKL